MQFAVTDVDPEFYMFVLRGSNDVMKWSRREFLDSLVLRVSVMHAAADRARRSASERTSISKFPTRTIWLCPPPQCANQRNIKWSFTCSFAARNAPRVYFIYIFFFFSSDKGHFPAIKSIKHHIVKFSSKFKFSILFSYISHIHLTHMRTATFSHYIHTLSLSLLYLFL